MADGDRASDDDCWFRVITDTRWINSDGSLAEQALKGNKLGPPKTLRPWSHELSGRLLSLVSDVAGDSIRFVEKVRSGLNGPAKTVAFSGVACRIPRDLRMTFGSYAGKWVMAG